MANNADMQLGVASASAQVGLAMASPVVWQHLTGPVVQELAGSPFGEGVAAVRVARAAATKASLNCMMSRELSIEQ